MSTKRRQRRREASGRRHGHRPALEHFDPGWTRRAIWQWREEHGWDLPERAHSAADFNSALVPDGDDLSYVLLPVLEPLPTLIQVAIRVVAATAPDLADLFREHAHLIDRACRRGEEVTDDDLFPLAEAFEMSLPMLHRAINRADALVAERIVGETASG